MTTQPAKNGTQWKVATAALTLFLVCTGAFWGMISVHAESPHKASLPRAEFTMFKDSVEGRLERIEDKLDRLLTR